MLFVEGLIGGISLIPYSLILYQLVLVGLLPLMLISFVPKIKNIFLKQKSIRYWFLGGLLIFCALTLVAYMMIYLSVREEVEGLMLGVVIFNIYSTLYLLLFKFYSNSKQSTFFKQKRKILFKL